VERVGKGKKGEKWKEKSGRIGEGNCCSGFDKRICQFITGPTYRRLFVTVQSPLLLQAVVSSSGTDSPSRKGLVEETERIWQKKSFGHISFSNCLEI